MAHSKAKPESPSESHTTAESAGNERGAQRVLGAFAKLRAWAAGHWFRRAAVAGTILVLIAATMAGWAYLASVALHSGTISIDVALHALDEGHLEEARDLVGRMLKSGRLDHSEYGGPLFVLGVIKTHDAEKQTIAEQRRTEYLVASRYLKEADAYGLPPTREFDGLFLLGKSYVESGQWEDGLHTLGELVRGNLPSDNPLAWEAHRLLSNTCLLMPQPDNVRALQHAEMLLTNQQLTDDQRASAQLQCAECLLRVDRFEDARQAVNSVPPAANRQAEVALMQGKIVLDEINAVLERVPLAQRKKVLDESTPKVAEAVQQLELARSLDKQDGPMTRQSAYHLGRGAQLLGQIDQAIDKFARARQLYGDTFEGLAATLAEADALRQKGELDEALLAYRRSLDYFSDMSAYRSVVLPLERVRERLMLALKDYLSRSRYTDALSLLEHFPPLFARSEQLALRGDTLHRQGEELLKQAADGEQHAARDHEAGLRCLRSAGMAYEQLAEERFATRFYTDDLWQSADLYFRGHSFTSAVRIVNKYLDIEPELRNPEALLRLGQAQLALGELPAGIAAFEECVEFHPFSGSTFQARIDCAKAYRSKGDASQAEKLLRDNLAADTLRPTSREWKDSLFELGMLLHEMNRHEDAIGTLEEAVERYPQDSQRLMSQYIIGEAYRRWAQELLDQTLQLRSENERTKNMAIIAERLATALANFEEVQRTITLKTHDIHSDPLMGSMLRNCYMLEGTVLFELQRYKEAIEAYSNVASLYPDEPFVLETFVQIANCWRRLNRTDKARGSIQQAQIALERLPADADFAGVTTLKREEWQNLLADMSRW